MKLDVKKITGKSSGEELTLSKKVFGAEPNEHAIWQVVTAQLAHQRQGTSAAKNRSLVSGGGKKPWKQKGRGTARAGTIRSPLWVGGGRIFGPEPRNYNPRLNKKVNRLARISALSLKAREEKIQLVEDFIFDEVKTKKVAELLKNLKLSDTKTLLITSDSNRNAWLSARNMQKITVRPASDISVYDIMNADVLLIQKSALTKIEEVLVK